MLEQLIALIKDVLVVDVVEVVTIMDPFIVEEPITFPKPAEAPPIFIPEPFVSIPIKVLELAAVGTEESDMPATVFPLM